jgi:hypothetical protein
MSSLGREGFFECITQQTSKRLQEYGANSFDAAKGIKGV